LFSAKGTVAKIEMATLDLELINEAAAFLAPRVRRTPLEKSIYLSDLLGVPVFLKLEFLQITGSFKLRGAMFRLSKLSSKERRAGVVTCSAGNHGWAVAYAARILEIPATVYVPAEVDESKAKGIASLGATVTRSEFPGYDATENFAVSKAESLNLTFISPYDDFAVMAANGGTIAREILEEVPEIRTFLTPVGGGGLAAGLGFYVKTCLKEALLVACQHTESCALQLSLEKGEAVTELPPIRTLAGGIEGGIGALTFSILKDIVDRVILLSEQEIVAALEWLLVEHRYLVEPSAAVTLAACLTEKLGHVETPVAIVLTGRNIAIDSLRSILGKEGSYQ
jgi:threonine dehydratase